MEKKRAKKRNLSGKLLIYFLLLSLVPLVLVGSMAFLIMINQLEKNAQAHLSDLARDCGSKISYYVSEVYQDTKRHNEPDIFRYDTETMQKHLVHLTETHHYYSAISVIDEKGTIIACTREKLVGQSRADQVWFRKTLQSRNIVPMDAYRAESAAGKVVLGLNVPIIDEENSEVIGILAARISINHIVETVWTLDDRIPQDNHVYLINSKGEILASPDEKGILNRSRFYDFPVVQELLAGKTGTSRFENDRDEDLISAQYALVGDGDFDGWGWGIIVTEPVSEVFKAAYLIRNILIAIVITIALAVSAVSVLIAKRLSKPIAEVSNSALRISRGDLQITEIRYDSQDEIGDLVTAFNKMSADLQSTTVSRDLLAKEITERKQAEIGKRKSEEKAQQQQQQIIQLDKMASLGILVAGVAHEINNPNQAIMSNANRIIEAWKSIVPILEEYYEGNGDFVVGGLNYSRMRKQMQIYQRGISEGAKSIGFIVNDLKNFARQENYEKHEEIDINQVINAAAALASNYIRKATRSLRVEIEENLPTIKGNFQRLEQVMINLIQNSCQALRDNEQGILITTSFDADRNCVEVKVRDDGAGIAPENLVRIKDPFFTTKRGTGGMGLGLSISATIIEDHQGTLTIASERGKGTTATISLPVIHRESRPRPKQDP